MDRRLLGKIGEDCAARILRAKGYDILHRNYRCSMGEIDIIASKNDTIAFIEVKTRSGNSYGRPCEAVDFCKQRHIRSAALCYMKETEGDRKGAVKISFDVMEITVEHIDNAF